MVPQATFLRKKNFILKTKKTEWILLIQHYVTPMTFFGNFENMITSWIEMENNILPVNLGFSSSGKVRKKIRKNDKIGMSEWLICWFLSMGKCIKDSKTRFVSRNVCANPRKK